MCSGGFLLGVIMASGRKNYFRHSFFARNDIKLRELRDRIGIGFYFYFFTLLEQCGENSSEKLQSNYEFHDSIIRNLWCINLKKSERIANEMMSVGLLFFEKREKTFYFEIPNFAKYLGKYEIKNETNSPNKRKENKRKENKIKGNEIKENENENAQIIEEIKNEVAIFELEKYSDLLHKVSEKLQRKWLEVYPLDHILKEFEKAETWLMANPNKKKNVGLFLTNWLSRSMPKEAPKTFAQIRQENILKMVNPYDNE